jgi:hypothetical protein
MTSKDVFAFGVRGVHRGGMVGPANGASSRS